MVRFTRDPHPALPPGEASQAAVQDLVNLATEARALGLPVWMVFWPTTMDGALSGRHIDERSWYDALDAAGVPYTGHALAERACWGFQDLFHPSEAGYRALAEVVSSLAAIGTSHRQLLRTPACADVPGLGPGKAP
jgi:lysophospholipase L1-like esterase